MAVRRCTCQHEYQDARYGQGMRVKNPLKKDAPRDWRCTVCGKED